MQWALPQLRMRWPGFRKVRGQICKRLSRRIHALGLRGPSHYRSYLEETPAEWPVLDSLCRITISCFYRDHEVFNQLHSVVLHRLAQAAHASARTHVDVWSIGCASGEEPYTLAIGVKLQAQPPLSDTNLRIVASDADATLLARAKTACYDWSSVKHLPSHWLSEAFEIRAQTYCLRPEYREGIALIEQDVRTTMPASRFDLILCRNLAFTYFDHALQKGLLAKLLARLRPHGALVIGKHESLPHDTHALAEWFAGLRIYRHVPGTTDA